MTEHKVAPAEYLERTAIKAKVKNHLYQTSVLHTQNHSQKGWETQQNLSNPLCEAAGSMV